jgi:PTH1 family peptidyl-tRNA hydrolase
MIIVGLGNPGKEYENTRHNIGQDIVMEFGRQNGFSSWYTPGHGEYMESHGEIDGKESVLVIPLTFMNISGRAVVHFVKKGEELSNLLVVHDDLDLPIGTIKESTNSGDGGHNGIKSIINVLGSKSFKRIRVGISPVGEDGLINKLKYKGLVEKYVLEKFEEGEWEKLVKEGVEKVSSN